MKITELCNLAKDKNNFLKLSHYADFGKKFIEFISNVQNIEAQITSQNEHCYKFIQYKEDANFNITRPINFNLYLPNDTVEKDFLFFFDALSDTNTLKSLSEQERSTLNKCIYTMQQSIGCALDALPAKENNKAKKINGDLFERLILLIFQHLRFDVNSMVERVNNIPGYPLKHQHDLAFKVKGELKLIGSVKTSSKDRIDKVFIDKFFYNKIKEVDIPHFAIFLNDVQREKSKTENEGFSINQTFVRGHFNAYTLVMNPLDGVYYCDLRPIMRQDNMLKQEIKRLDALLCNDIWKLMHQKAR